MGVLGRLRLLRSTKAQTIKEKSNNRFQIKTSCSLKTTKKMFTVYFLTYGLYQKMLMQTTRRLKGLKEILKKEYPDGQ